MNCTAGTIRLCGPSVSLIYSTKIHTMLTANNAKLIACIHLMHDIDSNPGPGLGNQEGVLKTMTLNCRGVNRQEKLRVMQDKVDNLLEQNLNTIVTLQETMITNSTYLDLAWRVTELQYRK